MIQTKVMKHISTEMIYAFLGTLLMGFLGHMYIFTNNFINWDGVYYFFVEDAAMVESGRWLLGGAAIISGKFTMPMVIGTLSVTYMALANCLMVKFFEIRRKGSALLIAGLVVLSPVVTGTFTYMFTADAYFLAYLLSVLAAFCAKYISNPWVGVLASGALLCASFGIYQAYGAVAIILLMLDSVMLLLTVNDTKKLIIKFVVYICSIGVGFGCYMLIMKLSLKWKNVVLNDYQGISGLNHISIGELFKRIPEAYKYTWKYITTGELTHYNFVMFLCAACIFSTGIIILLYLMIQCQKKYRIILIVLDLAALPLALNMFSLVSEQTVNHLLMKMSWLMPFVFIICLSEKIEFKISKMFRTIMVAGIALVIFFYYQMANIVYVNIEQRQERTYTLATRLLWRMEQLDEYYDGIPIITIGSPWTETGSWLPGELFDIPGATGRYYVSSGHQFVQIYFNYLGVPFNYQWDTSLREEIIQTEEYQDMGVWPDKDAIKIINDKLIINFPLHELER